MAKALKFLQRCTSRPWLSLGWIIVLWQAVGVLRLSLARPSFYLYAPIYFVLLAVAGLVCRWGVTTMFTLGGFCSTFYHAVFLKFVYSDYLEPVIDGLIKPAICAIVGLVIGACWESVNRRARGGRRSHTNRENVIAPASDTTSRA